MSRRRALLGAVVLLGALVASGCTTDGEYRAGARLAITAPPDRAAVGLPVRIAWTADPDASGYVVVLDRVPMPPGETVAWFGPDAEGVVETDETEVLLGRSVSASHSGPVRHEAVVVSVDDRGRRLDETSARVSFRTGGGE